MWQKLWKCSNNVSHQLLRKLKGMQIAASNSDKIASLIKLKLKVILSKSCGRQLIFNRNTR